MYKTTVYCPVCNEIIDILKHPDKEINGYASLVLNDSRHTHGEQNPQCTRHRDWIKGWIYGQSVYVVDCYCCICKNEMDYNLRYGKHPCCSKTCWKTLEYRIAVSIVGK